MFNTFSIADPGPSSHTRRPPGRACDACRRLKIKCWRQDALPCNQCRREGIRCTYNDRPARRGRPRKQHSSESGIATPGMRILLGPDTPHLSASGSVTQGAVKSTSPQRVEGTSSPSARTASQRELRLDDIKSRAGIARDDSPQSPRLDAPQVSNDEIWRSVAEFFDTTYMIFPIVSYADLVSRLITEPDWNSVPDLRTLLLAICLLNATAQYRIDSENVEQLYELIHEVETSRLCHNFADPATLDAVVCSLVLFAVYNVLGKQNRAFLYLDEALSLFEAVVPWCLCAEEEQRYLRIERVLFNTEAAANAIYATRTRHRRARRPLINRYECLAVQEGFCNDVESDRLATLLLSRLTRIHSAEDADTLEEVEVEMEADMGSLFGAVLRRHRYPQIQAADVAITRQWQLSSKLVTGRSGGNLSSRLLRPSAEDLGIVAMSWICLLREGELRIVGLGKIAGLAMNISMLVGPTCGQDILRGLTGAIVREDHEEAYTPFLANMLEAMGCSIPPLIGTQAGAERDLYPEHTAGQELMRSDWGNRETESDRDIQIDVELESVDAFQDFLANDVSWTFVMGEGDETSTENIQIQDY